MKKTNDQTSQIRPKLSEIETGLIPRNNDINPKKNPKNVPKTADGNTESYIFFQNFRGLSGYCFWKSETKGML